MTKILKNPVYRKETKLRVRSAKFAFTVLFYNLVLVGIAMFGFVLSFNANWNNYIDYKNVTYIYWTLIILEAVMVLFLVPSFTAGSIAGEREKQTLEILLTTPMKPSEIIIGKMMSSISMVLLLVVSSLPAVSMVFTIGGVGVKELVQFVIIVFVFSVFIGSIGVLLSTAIQRTVLATVATFGIEILLCVGTVMVVGAVYIIANMYYNNVMNGVGAEPDVSWILLLLLVNPAFTLIEMIGSQYTGVSMAGELADSFGGNMPDVLANHWFGCSLFLQLLLTVLFIWQACRILNPVREKKKQKKVDEGQRFN